MSGSTIIFIVILAAVIGMFFYMKNSSVKGVRNLSADELAQELTAHPEYTLIDVREPREFASGYIPGAVNIPLSQLNQRFNEIPQDKPIALYCQSGMRSKSAGKFLYSKGYAQLSHLNGGISSWRGKRAK